MNIVNNNTLQKRRTVVNANVIKYCSDIESIIMNNEYLALK